MPNIGTVLREEISRLSRREIRSQVDATKKATTQHRRQIAALKRQVAQLERQVTLLVRKFLDTPQAVSAASTAIRPRFVAKGLRSQRKRLGLSATDYGKLLGVSAQSSPTHLRQLASRIRGRASSAGCSAETAHVRPGRESGRRPTRPHRAASSAQAKRTVPCLRMGCGAPRDATRFPAQSERTRAGSVSADSAR